MLNQKQKEMKDKKVEVLSAKIADKQSQLARNDAQAQEVHDRVQSELDELLLEKKAFEDLK